MTPIFVLITRSFWLGVGAVAVYLQAGEPVVRATADLACLALGCDPDAVTGHLMGLLPLVLWLLALHQRSGAARPYTLRMTPETLR